MAKGTTTSGFEYDIDDEIADDMELIDALAELDGGNALAMSTVCRLVLGDSRKAFYDHLRTESGHVPTSLVSRELVEIINGLNSGKK